MKYSDPVRLRTGCECGVIIQSGALLRARGCSVFTQKIMLDEHVTQVRVASGSNIQTCVARVLQTLEALPAQAVVRLVAQGNAVAKAVTIAEISRRRLRRLHQNTQVGLVRNA